ncbi:hypothetical protein N9P79_00750 [Crocinitomicaceae bacterium]|nr:hypothetical protein [Crocinitomicaceae bacterium]
MRIKKKQRYRGGSKSSPHTPADLPECAYPAFGGRHAKPMNATCKSSPDITNPLVIAHDAGAVTQWAGDHVSGIIKWAGDTIGNMTPAPKPKIVHKGQEGGTRRRVNKNKKRTKRIRHKRRKKHKRYKKPKGASADITPVSREWMVRNNLAHINRFANDTTIPDKGDKFLKLVNEMKNSGLTDGYFIIDYNSSRSPGHYGRYLISFDEEQDNDLLPDATIYTGGYAYDISEAELIRMRRENEARAAARELERERIRMRNEELARQRDIEIVEAMTLGITVDQLRTRRRMEEIERSEQRERAREQRQREHYFANLPENENVVVFENPDGDINLGTISERPVTPINEIPVTQPSLYQRIRTTMNRMRRNRVRPNNVARGHGKSKKRRKRNITKRKKKKRRKRKK